jgi:hypothetical protein
MILSPMSWTSNLSCSLCLRTHFEQNLRRLSTPKFCKVKVLNLQEHAYWAKCCQLPQLMLHFKLLDKRRTWWHHIKRCTHQGCHLGIRWFT